MKLTSTIVLLAPLVSALSIFNPSSHDAKALDANFPVPGDQPLSFCQDPSNYILKVHNVVLEPNPPVPGKKLIIRGNGTFSEQIEEGATVMLQVKYGLITLIKTERDVCEQLPKIDMECPIKEGLMEVYREVDIPAQVPPGKYTVHADLKTVDDRTITCMEASVFMSRS